MTAETVEILYALHAEDLIVGVSGYTVRPEAARTKPKVSAFTSAKIDKILELKPDLVITFSDLQKDIVRDLIGLGINVLALNERTLDEIVSMFLLLGRIVGRDEEAHELARNFEGSLEEVRESARLLPRRPRVYFEEWDDPLISGIHWVSELIEVAGGEDIFAGLRKGKAARERVVEPAEVIQRNPEVIIASWCGKKVAKEKIRARAGWEAIEAVTKGQIYEIKSPNILMPGPSLLIGLREIHEALRFAAFSGRQEGQPLSR